MSGELRNNAISIDEVIDCEQWLKSLENLDLELEFI